MLKKVNETLQKLKSDRNFLEDKVYLSSKNISDQDVEAIAEGLKKHHSIKKLWLNNNKFSVKGATAIANALKTTKSLQELDLSNNNIGDQGAIELSTAINQSPLCELWLGSNKISDTGATALSEALAKSQTLKILDLGYNLITDRGVAYLSDALKTAPLVELYLYGNKITDGGAYFLANVVKTSKTLQVLNLGNNQIGNDGARALASALPLNTSLKRMDIEMNSKITDEGGRELLAGVKQTGEIFEQIMLFGTSISPKLKGEIENAVTSKSLPKEPKLSLRDSMELTQILENRTSTTQSLLKQWTDTLSEIPEFNQDRIPEYAQIFTNENVRLMDLPDLKDQDLKDLGISAFGSRKAILKYAQLLVTGSQLVPNFNNNNNDDDINSRSRDKNNLKNDLNDSQASQRVLMDHPDDDESLQNFNAISTLSVIAIPTLDDAVEELKKQMPDLARHAGLAKLAVSERRGVLSLDQAAAINLYTREFDNGLYQKLNQSLRACDRGAIKPFLPMLKLLLNGISKLPFEPEQTFYRGVKLDLTKLYPQGRKVVWWGFSSCTRTLKVLETDQFLGAEGPRTLFHVRTRSAVDVSQWSAVRREDEVLLRPCVYFVVKSVANLGNGLTAIELEEIPLPFPMLEF